MLRKAENPRCSIGLLDQCDGASESHQTEIREVNAGVQSGLRHVRTKPYTPRTNGKAERFIQTASREWAYARAYETSKQRADELMLWTHLYNWHRPHGGIKNQTPISRLGLKKDNLLRLHI